MRWYSPRDWISCDEISGSHDHSDDKDVEDNDSLQYNSVTNSNTTSDLIAGDVVTNNSSDNDVTNSSSNTPDNVTNNSNTNFDVTINNNTSGWDEDWAEIEEEQTSSSLSGAPTSSHKVSP